MLYLNWKSMNVIKNNIIKLIMLFLFYQFFVYSYLLANIEILRISEDTVTDNSKSDWKIQFFPDLSSSEKISAIVSGVILASFLERITSCLSNKELKKIDLGTAVFFGLINTWVFLMSKHEFNHREEQEKAFLLAIKKSLEAADFKMNDILIRRMNEWEIKNFPKFLAYVDKKESIKYNLDALDKELKLIRNTTLLDLLGKNDYGDFNKFDFVEYIAAHEVGHVLPKDKAPDYHFSVTDNEEKREEQRADYYAAKYLCESDKIKVLLVRLEGYKKIHKDSTIWKDITVAEHAEWLQNMYNRCKKDPIDGRHRFYSGSV